MAAFRREWTGGECDTTVARHQFIDWLETNDIGVADWAVVFSELLHNACTARPPGSAIHVEAFTDERVVLRVTNVTTGTIPRVRHNVPADTPSGRGLLIAAALTDSLTFEVDDHTVTVTCSVGQLVPAEDRRRR